MEFLLHIVAFIIFIVVFAYGIHRVEGYGAELLSFIFFGAQYSRKEYDLILRRKSEYYSDLSASEKKIFIYRVNNFIRYKNFIARDGLVLDLEKKIQIAAAAVQLTFGLKKYLFKHFKTIIVFRDIYKNLRTGRKHKGEVNPTGAIVLSWKYFERGFDDMSDNINLGLHEMAHALDITYSLVEKNQHIQGEYLEQFKRNAFKLYLNIKHGVVNYYRNYAGANLREFFAVTVEVFFENPHDLHHDFPEVYKNMCVLLNQDPINKKFRIIDINSYKS